MLVVIDGLGSRPLKRALEAGHAPNLQRLLDAGARFDDAISPFPSLTPVCLATIVTGTGPDGHRIPSLSWYNRGEHRFVEYGSSFSAAAVEGHARAIEDVVLNLNHLHLADEPRTLFEVFEDADKPAAAINYLVYRGRTRHTMKHAYLSRVGERTGVSAVYGPRYFYWGELFGSMRPLLPQVGIKRPRDWGAAHVARWLMRNTPTEFLLLYLGQHDVASHKAGPDETQRAIRIADRAMGRAIDAMGGIDQFVEECALVLCADHGQTSVWPGQHGHLADVFDDVELYRGRRESNAHECDLAISPSNRFAHIYRLQPGAPDEAWIADRALESPAVDLATWRDADGGIVVRRGDAELVARKASDAGSGNGPVVRTTRTVEVAGRDAWRLQGDLQALDIALDGDTVGYGAYPDALARLDAALSCVNTGDVLLSGKVGWEFVDIGGGFHTGGSHGSLHEIDSTAPLVTLGLDGDTPGPGDASGGLLRLSDIYRFVTSHFEL